MSRETSFTNRFVSGVVSFFLWKTLQFVEWNNKI